MLNALKITSSIAAFLLNFIHPVCAEETPVDEAPAACKEIWAREKSIYASRKEGNFQPYINGASDNFIVPNANGNWTPGKEVLEATKSRLRGQSKEELAMTLKAFTLEGDTAVIYYLNHRTRLPNGANVDQWYEIMHVWHRDNGDWRLLGSMPRQLIAAPISSPNLSSTVSSCGD